MLISDKTATFRLVVVTQIYFSLMCDTDLFLIFLGHFHMCFYIWHPICGNLTSEKSDFSRKHIVLPFWL